MFEYGFKLLKKKWILCVFPFGIRDSQKTVFHCILKSFLEMLRDKVILSYHYYAIDGSTKNDIKSSPALTESAVFNVLSLGR